MQRRSLLRLLNASLKRLKAILDAETWTTTLMKVRVDAMFCTILKTKEDNVVVPRTTNRRGMREEEDRDKAHKVMSLAVNAARHRMVVRERGWKEHRGPEDYEENHFRLINDICSSDCCGS